jgi:hypothetical protein
MQEWPVPTRNGRLVVPELGRNMKFEGLECEWLEGQHNHITPVLSMGMGIPAEKAWGWRVVEFAGTNITTSRRLLYPHTR